MDDSYGSTDYQDDKDKKSYDSYGSSDYTDKNNYEPGYSYP